MKERAWGRGEEKSEEERTTEEREGERGISPIYSMYLYTLSYTFIYLHIPPNTFIYLHIPSYTFI